MTDKIIRTQIALDRELWGSFKDYAQKKGRSANKQLIELIKKELEEEKNKVSA